MMLKLSANSTNPCSGNHDKTKLCYNAEAERQFNQYQERRKIKTMTGSLIYLSLAFAPLVCFAEDATSPVQKRREQKEETRTENTHWPHYEGCQDMPEQPFSASDLSSSEEETEARALCGLHCKRFLNDFGFFRDLTHSVTKTDFQRRLQERVSLQIESKIVEIRIMKACIAEDKDYLLSLYKDKGRPFIQEACQKKEDDLKNSIKKLWPEMARSLSLISPALKEDRILPDSSTWLDAGPSHKVSVSGKNIELSQSELKRAEETYIEALVKVYKENYKVSSSGLSQDKKPLSNPANDSRAQHRLTPEELRSYLKGDRAFAVYGKKRLSSKDTFHLKSAVEDLRETSKQRYFEIINEMPLLAYLESGAPSDKRLVKAFSQIEENLKEFLDKIKKQKDMDLLLSFEPLVEELLAESRYDDEDNSPYCLVAERARLQSERTKKSKENFLFGAMLAMLVPCFLGGGLSISICLGGEAALGVYDIDRASTAAALSLSRVLTGKQFESISNLKEKQRELKIAQWLFPLLFVEAGLVIKAGTKLRNRKKTEGKSAGEGAQPEKN